MEEKNKIILCFCGNTSSSHNYYHDFIPSIHVRHFFSSDKGDSFMIDADEYKALEQFEKCSYPNCNASKLLHGPIVKHEFIPLEKIKKRIIRFTIPLHTQCRVCKDKLETHNSLTHAFTTAVKVENKTEHDEVRLKGKTTEQTIINMH